MITRSTLRARLGLVAALVCCSALLLGSGSALAATASSVEQYGITWHFDREHEVGRYANGDWWVLGPVTITKITPESREVSGRVINGSMVNPAGVNHGYDNFQAGNGPDSPSQRYSESLNVAPSRAGPLNLDTGTVFSSISIPDGEIRNDGRPTLKTLALLTVVKDRPNQDDFRPNPYVDDDKRSHWNARDLDFSILRSLPRVGSTPNLDDIKRRVQRFWNEQDTNWTARPVHARDNQRTYGRDLGAEMGEALLSLHLDYSDAEKRDLFISVVQYGLDVFGRLQAGALEMDSGWVPNGGHNNGRKMPMVLAGIALGDNEIRSRADREEDPIRFQEDGQTFYVSQSDVNNPEHTNPYSQVDVGMPEWAFRYWIRSNQADSNWGASYRWIGSAMLSHALAAHLTADAVEVWNWPPFFDYMDRYFKNGSPSSSGANAISAFTKEMWEAYRDAGVNRPLPPTLIQ